MLTSHLDEPILADKLSLTHGWVHNDKDHQTLAWTSTSRTNYFSTREERATMPLKKSTSKEAFRQNIKAEVKSGKPVKQAVAIAYSVKREAAKGKSKK